MLIKIDLTELKEEILADILENIRDMIQEEMQSFIDGNQDSWDAMQAKLQDELKKMIVSDYKKELWEAFHDFRMEMKGISSGDHINSKVDTLARNQDALYLEIQELKCLLKTK
jgi:hypothetical protein